MDPVTPAKVERGIEMVMKKSPIPLIGVNGKNELWKPVTIFFWVSPIIYLNCKEF